MRQYIRHPVDVPIEIRTSRASPVTAMRTSDVSHGGLAVRSDQPVAEGALIHVRIPYVQPAFEALARVAWCHPAHDGGHELGIAFLDADDAFHARMVEQVCYIEDYRASVARVEGRHLTAEEAAGEWIAKFAATFPGGTGSPVGGLQ
jgi:hypothetical protein